MFQYEILQCLFYKSRVLFFSLLITGILATSCSDNPGNAPSEPEPEPEPNEEITVGNLEIKTITTGLDPEPRGYTVVVQDVESIETDANDTVVSEDLDAGTYTIELTEIEDHCTVESENPVTANVIAEETASVDFQVNCKGIFRDKIVFFRSQSQNSKAMSSLATQSYYAMNYDGSGMAKVNDFSLDGSINFASNISPDGTKIVVVYSENSGTDTQIAIINAYEDELIFLNDSVEGTTYSFPVFSPDGTKIAYIKSSDSFRKKDIYMMNSDGSNEVQITNSEELEESVGWSSDGAKIVYHRSSKDYKYQGIFSINKDGTNQQLIINSDLEFTNPVWSPNGNKLAVVGSKMDPYYYQEIYIMNNDGTNIRKVVSKQGESIYYSGLQWTPDSNKILFLSNRDGDPHDEFGYAYEPMDIFSINVDGSNLANLTNSKDSDESNLMLSP